MIWRHVKAKRKAPTTAVPLLRESEPRTKGSNGGSAFGRLGTSIPLCASFCEKRFLSFFLPEFCHAPPLARMRECQCASSCVIVRLQGYAKDAATFPSLARMRECQCASSCEKWFLTFFLLEFSSSSSSSADGMNLHVLLGIFGISRRQHKILDPHRLLEAGWSFGSRAPFMIAEAPPPFPLFNIIKARGACG